MRKLLAVAITSFLIIGLSSAAWCSSLSGTDWDVVGKWSVKVKIEGEGSASDKGIVYDWFTFYSNGYFDTIDFDGEWIEDAKGKFSVDLYHDTIESFIEDLVWDATGIDATANVESASFTGKMKGKKGVHTIKGKYKIVVSFYNAFHDLYGTITMQYKFFGTQLYLDASQTTPADKGDSSEFNAALRGAIQESLGEAALNK